MKRYALYVINLLGKAEHDEVDTLNKFVCSSRHISSPKAFPSIPNEAANKTHPGVYLDKNLIRVAFYPIDETVTSLEPKF